MEENCNGLFGRRFGESTGYIVAPELHAEGANCGIRGEIWDSSKLDVKSSDGEVGIS